METRLNGSSTGLVTIRKVNTWTGLIQLKDHYGLLVVDHSSLKTGDAARHFAVDLRLVFATAGSVSVWSAVSPEWVFDSGNPCIRKTLGSWAVPLLVCLLGTNPSPGVVEVSIRLSRQQRVAPTVAIRAQFADPLAASENSIGAPPRRTTREPVTATGSGKKNRLGVAGAKPPCARPEKSREAPAPLAPNSASVFRPDRGPDLALSRRCS